MDARLSEEQELLQSTVRELARALGPGSPAELESRELDEAGWSQLAEIGVLGIRLPESAGGFPMSGVEVALVAAELGAFVVPQPFIGSAVLASELLCAAGAESATLERLATGSLRLAPVLDLGLERLARRGEAGVAWDARGAHAGLVLDEDGRRLVAVELAERTDCVDLTRSLFRIRADAAASDVCDPGGALDAERRARFEALALTALAADLVGNMEGALDDSVRHVSDRQQFGSAVGSFQAVQHLAAEARVSLEAARSAVFYAAWGVDLLPADEALLAARVAKACAAIESRAVMETALQMHGGVGFTWEYLTHVRVRRALLSRKTLGDERPHLAGIADVRLAAPAGAAYAAGGR